MSTMSLTTNSEVRSQRWRSRGLQKCVMIDEHDVARNWLNNIGTVSRSEVNTRSSRHCTKLWTSPGFRYKICTHRPRLLIGLYVRLGVRPQHQLQPTVVSPPVLSTVVNRVRRSESVVHSRRLFHWRHLSRTGGGPVSFRSAIFVFKVKIEGKMFLPTSEVG